MEESLTTPKETSKMDIESINMEGLQFDCKMLESSPSKVTNTFPERTTSKESFNMDIDNDFSDDLSDVEQLSEISETSSLFRDSSVDKRIEEKSYNNKLNNSNKSSPTRSISNGRRRKSSISSIDSTISTLSPTSSLVNETLDTSSSTLDIENDYYEKKNTKNLKSKPKGMKELLEVTEPESEEDKYRKNKSSNTNKKSRIYSQKIFSSESSDLSSLSHSLDNSEIDSDNDDRNDKSKNNVNNKIIKSKKKSSKLKEESLEKTSNKQNKSDIDSDSNDELDPVGMNDDDAEKALVDALNIDPPQSAYKKRIQDTPNGPTPNSRFYGTKDYYDPILNPDYVSPYTEFTRPLIDPNDIDGSDYEYGKAPSKSRNKKQKSKKKRNEESRKHKMIKSESTDDISSKRSSKSTRNDNETDNEDIKIEDKIKKSNSTTNLSTTAEALPINSDNESMDNKSNLKKSKLQKDDNTNVKKSKKVNNESDSNTEKSDEGKESESESEEEEIAEVLEIFAKSDKKDKEKDKARKQALLEFQKIQIERYNALKASFGGKSGNNENELNSNKDINSNNSSRRDSSITVSSINNSNVSGRKGSIYKVAPVLLANKSNKSSKSDYPQIIKIREANPDEKVLLGKRLVRRELINKQDLSGQTYLHKYAAAGSYADVYRLIEAGADINIRDSANWTPLHEAAHGGHLEIVELLIFVGADVNSHGQDDDTPLHDALFSQNIELIKRLLIHGAELSLLNNDNKSSWNIAESNIRKEIVKFSKLYESLKKTKDELDINGNTKLQLACKKQNFKLVHKLLLAGHPVNHKNKDGETALLLSVKNNDLKIAEDLIKFGANFNSLVPYAVRRDLIDFVKLFTKYGANLTSRYGTSKKPLDQLAPSNKMKNLLDILQENIDKGDKTIVRKPKFFQPIIIRENLIVSEDMIKEFEKDNNINISDIYSSDDDNNNENHNKLEEKVISLDKIKIIKDNNDEEKKTNNKSIKATSELSIESEFNRKSTKIVNQDKDILHKRKRIDNDSIEYDNNKIKDNDEDIKISKAIKLSDENNDKISLRPPIVPSKSNNDITDKKEMEEQNININKRDSIITTPITPNVQNIKLDDKYNSNSSSSSFGDQNYDYFNDISEREKRKIEKLKSKEEEKSIKKPIINEKEAIIVTPSKNSKSIIVELQRDQQENKLENLDKKKLSPSNKKQNKEDNIEVDVEELIDNKKEIEISNNIKTDKLKSKVKKTFNQIINEIDSKINNFQPKYTKFINEDLLSSINNELNSLSDYNYPQQSQQLQNNRVQIIIEEQDNSKNLVSYPKLISQINQNTIFDRDFNTNYKLSKDQLNNLKIGFKSI